MDHVDKIYICDISTNLETKISKNSIFFGSNLVFNKIQDGRQRHLEKGYKTCHYYCINGTVVDPLLISKVYTVFFFFSSLFSFLFLFLFLFLLLFFFYIGNRTNFCLIPCCTYLFKLYKIKLCTTSGTSLSILMQIKARCILSLIKAHCWRSTPSPWNTPLYIKIGRQSRHASYIKLLLSSDNITLYIASCLTVHHRFERHIFIFNSLTVRTAVRVCILFWLFFFSYFNVFSFHAACNVSLSGKSYSFSPFTNLLTLVSISTAQSSRKLKFPENEWIYIKNVIVFWNIFSLN